MYKIKEDEIKKYKKWGIVRRISKETGLTESYISKIFNDKKRVSDKVCAYAITKAIGSELEIENLFEIM